MNGWAFIGVKFNNLGCVLVGSKVISAPQVKVMSSMRRPKRLIIRGDDERDHPFLVKGSEDLRQDQRIEQLFAVMNIVLSHDTSCMNRGLQLHTYQVIPITTRYLTHLLCALTPADCEKGWNETQLNSILFSSSVTPSV